VLHVHPCRVFFDFKPVRREALNYCSVYFRRPPVIGTARDGELHPQRGFLIAIVAAAAALDVPSLAIAEALAFHMRAGFAFNNVGYPKSLIAQWALVTCFVAT